MKYLVLIPDGMADEKIEELGGKTPMEAAKKPTCDYLASMSEVGLVSNVPEGIAPGSDAANMAVLSFDPKVYSKGRSPLEAVSMGLQMNDTQVAFRCNIVTLSEDEEYDEKTIIDHSADEISTEEADELIKAVEEAFGNDERHFYTGVSYRHCLLWEGVSDSFPFTPPHDILGKCIKDYLPAGEDGKIFYDIMKASWDILDHHPINEARRARGLRPANSIWLWSPGKKPALPSFKEKWGIDGAVISAVDLIKGIGLCAGMQSIDVKGATGNVHTNYDGKAQAAIEAFENGTDYVYVHVEGPDECGHRAETENKVLSIELIDEKILGPIYEYLKGCGDDFKIVILPDHPTPIRLRTHTMDAVPYMIYSSIEEKAGVSTFTEDSAAATGNYLSEGHRLMDKVIERNTEGDPSDGDESETKKNAILTALKSLFDYVEIFSFAILAILLIFTFCFRLCRVDGSSMNNTLQNQEMLITTNVFYEPEQGDIIVFHLSNDHYRQPLVKRVIATEGQTVDVNFTTGKVCVDGVVLEEDYIYLDGGKYDMRHEFDKQYISTDEKGETHFTATVPEGTVFAMGDNRNHSTDSRAVSVSFVDKNCILGKAVLRLSPLTFFD